MKRIIIAFDGANFSEGALEMAVQLHQVSPIHLTGAFISQIDYDRLWNYSGESELPKSGIESKDLIEKNIARFEDACKRNSIGYVVRKDYFGFALPELKQETRFADLLILGGETFYGNNDEDLNDYIKEALNKTECPTLVVPENFYFPRSIILAYDGTESSVYAIKQFAYLFPQLSMYSTLLVYSEDEEEGIPERENINILASLHFPNLRMVKLNADPDTDFVNWLSEKKRSLLVTGAFGRSLFSQLFRKSFVSDILQQHQIPVFIAHK